MKYLRLLGVTFMLFCISVKADAGIRVQSKGLLEKFEMVKEFKVTMPKYDNDLRGGRTGKDEKSGVIFAENSHISRELIYPQNFVVAGQVFIVQLWRVVGRLDQDDLGEFLDTQISIDFVGLQSIMLKEDVPTQHMSPGVLWKNNKSDPGLPLMGCMVNKDIWFLSAVFDLDFSGTTEFLVFQRW